VSGHLDEASAFWRTLGRYWFTVRSHATRELRCLRQQALRIPDPVLKAQAGFVLNEESWTIEGAALLATLVRPPHLVPAVRSMVCFQAMYNYVDTLSEEPNGEPLRNTRQLSRAILDVFEPEPRRTPYYLHHDHGDDGGFLRDLVSKCRTSLNALPSLPAILHVAKRGADRCREGQGRTHAAIYGGPESSEALAAWASQLDVGPTYMWWEGAAGAISTLSILALIAAAADPRTDPAEAGRVEAAYFPSACALSTLLDSVIDSEHDSLTGNFSTASYYETNQVAAERVGGIAGESNRNVRSLHRGLTHAAVLNVVVASYLSAVEAGTDYAQPVAAQVLAELKPMAPHALTAMRLHRRFGSGLSDSGARSRPFPI
jgi:tetraprenyl-beta-curcumene synthase